jgi:hypothetical protein
MFSVSEKLHWDNEERVGPTTKPVIAAPRKDKLQLSGFNKYNMCPFLQLQLGQLTK